MPKDGLRYVYKAFTRVLKIKEHNHHNPSNRSRAHCQSIRKHHGFSNETGHHRTSTRNQLSKCHSMDTT